MTFELIVIGGGPAGLAAALSAYRSGLRSIAILERDKEAGGILNQCIHNGFGLHRFKTELTGPEYAGRFIDMLKHTTIRLITDTMVLRVTPDKKVYCVSPDGGYRVYEAKSIIMAMGCRERTRGAIGIPGDRPSGVFTAGTAQRYLNLEGYLCGKRVVILGSGDIGLIMARRMTLEGAQVLACVEVMPFSSGLNRNLKQCLEDFGIPLYLSHTVTDIRSEKGRLSAVTVMRVDEKRAPVPGTEMHFDCDTLLLSVGLIPETELMREAGIELDRRTNGAVVYEDTQTSVPGIFACGNVLHVHDLVDYVSEESEKAGCAAARYVLENPPHSAAITVKNGPGVTYTVPQVVHTDALKDGLHLFFRVNRVIKNAEIEVSGKDGVIYRARRIAAAPGEMQELSLSAATAGRIDADITISTKEAQA